MGFGVEWSSKAVFLAISNEWDFLQFNVVSMKG